MKNEKIFLLLYELKGTVDSLSLIAEYDDTYHHPVIEQISAKVDEICSLIQSDVSPERPRTQLDLISKGVDG